MSRPLRVQVRVRLSACVQQEQPGGSSSLLRELYSQQRALAIEFRLMQLDKFYHTFTTELDSEFEHQVSVSALCFTHESVLDSCTLLEVTSGAVRVHHRRVHFGEQSKRLEQWHAEQLDQLKSQLDRQRRAVVKDLKKNIQNKSELSQCVADLG